MFNSRSRSLFSATQRQELEQQALIYKYIVSGVSIPPELLYSVKTSLESSLSSTLFPHPPIGWGCFQVGFGRKVDPEPGRCRRTDGKKWRCSKEAQPDSKYCEKHMHRGRNRSRKPVEQLSSTPTSSVPSYPCSISSTNNKITSPSNIYFSPVLSRPPGSSFSIKTNETHNLFLHSSGAYSHPERDYSYCQGTRDRMYERAFFPEASGNVRNLQESYEHLTMSSYKDYNSQPQFHGIVDTSKQYEQEEQNHSFVLGADFKSKTSRPIKLEKDFDDTDKPMHHFFGDHQRPPKNTDSWLDLASTSSRTIHSDSSMSQ